MPWSARRERRRRLRTRRPRCRGIERECGVRPIDLPDAIDLAVDRTALLDDGQREPVLALGPLSTAADVDADRVRRLDPTRIQFDPELLSPAGRPARGPVGSLILHLLPLLAL